MTATARALAASSLPAELETRPARPLDAALRGTMERSFGTSLGDVAVHTDAAAAASAERLDAKAYTFGRHVVFGPGRYDPHSPSGRALIAHELAHVVQQRRGGPAPDTNGLHRAGGPAEAAAHHAGVRAAAGLSAPVTGGTAPGVARAPKGEEEEKSAWKQLLRAKAASVLGRVEGVVLEGGQIVDTVVGLPYAAETVGKLGVDALAKHVGLSDESRNALHEVVGAVTTGPALNALRDKAKEHGWVDPQTGAPAVSHKITAVGDRAEAAIDSGLGTAQPTDSLFTDREIAQLEGSLAAQGVLAVVGAEEVQLALKVVGSVGSVKAILDAIAANPESWPREPAFWLQVANAVLFVAGLRASSASRKLATILIDAAMSSLAVAPVVAQLKNDLVSVQGPERDAAIKRDLVALVKALVGVLQQVITHARNYKSTAAHAASPVAPPHAPAHTAPPAAPAHAPPPQPSAGSGKTPGTTRPRRTPQRKAAGPGTAPAKKTTTGTRKAAGSRPRRREAPPETAVAESVVRAPADATPSASTKQQGPPTTTPVAHGGSAEHATTPGTVSPEAAGGRSTGPTREPAKPGRPPKNARPPAESGSDMATSTPASAGVRRARKPLSPQAQARKLARRAQLKEARAEAKALNAAIVKDPAALDRLEAFYKSQPDHVLRALKKDPVAAAVLDARERTNPELARILADDSRMPHQAAVKVVDADGGVARTERLRSGGVTKDQRRRLGPREAARASHTEAKATAEIPLKPGQTMYIAGDYNPCRSCQLRMQAKADQTGGRVNYHWPGGPPGGVTYTPGGPMPSLKGSAKAPAKVPAANAPAAKAPRLGAKGPFDPKLRRPSLTGLGRAGAVAGPVDRHAGVRTNPDARVSVFHDPLGSHAPPVEGGATPAGGHSFERSVRADLGAEGLPREHHSAGDRPRVGDVGRYEVKHMTELDSHALDQVWRDLVAHGTAHVIMPKIGPRSEQKLALMAAGFEKLTGRRAHIAVRETGP
ncbi:MAG TPA: DUF4157 domain-containing protein [Yinghuangia sp.]|nr:DUF4157 domain-containing protein [Yinghuangia sp.]